MNAEQIFAAALERDGNVGMIYCTAIHKGMSRERMWAALCYFIHEHSEQSIFGDKDLKMAQHKYLRRQYEGVLEKPESEEKQPAPVAQSAHDAAHFAAMAKVIAAQDALIDANNELLTARQKIIEAGR